MRNRAVIVAGGSFSPQSIKKLCSQLPDGSRPNFIIGCDRGASYLLDAHIAPDLVVGDLDSIGTESLNKIIAANIPVESFPTDKDFSDLELAVEAAIERGYSDIVVTCALGRRTDFMLANCVLLLRHKSESLTLSIIEDREEIYPCYTNRPVIITEKKSRTFSIVPYGHKNVVSIEGARWNLNYEPVEIGYSRLVSNIAAEQTLTVTFHEGCGLLVIQV